MAYRKPPLEGARATAHAGIDSAERRRREAVAAEEKLRMARMANMARLRALRLEKEAADAAEAQRIALETPTPVKKVRKPPVKAVAKSAVKAISSTGNAPLVGKAVAS